MPPWIDIKMKRRVQWNIGVRDELIKNYEEISHHNIFAFVLPG
jgi:hypothetical protein